MKNKTSFFNKSSVTNFIALVIAVGGYFSPWFRDQLFSMGIFALSGALTNWLAVFMLFEKVPLLYGSGVIQNRFSDIKEGIGNLIMGEFFNEKNLTDSVEFLKKDLIKAIDLDKAVEKIDYHGIFDTLVEQILDSKLGGMLGMFGGASLLERYRDSMVVAMQQTVQAEISKPGFMENLFPSEDTLLVRHVTVRIEEVIQKRLDELTAQQVKIIIQDMIRQHLGWLVVWGGVFGGVIGLAASFLQNLF